MVPLIENKCSVIVAVIAEPWLANSTGDWKIAYVTQPRFIAEILIALTLALIMHASKFIPSK